jgi:hypothetical protein
MGAGGALDRVVPADGHEAAARGARLESRPFAQPEFAGRVIGAAPETGAAFVDALDDLTTAVRLGAFQTGLDLVGVGIGARLGGVLESRATKEWARGRLLDHQVPDEPVFHQAFRAHLGSDLVRQAPPGHIGGGVVQPDRVRLPSAISSRASSIRLVNPISTSSGKYSQRRSVTM